MIRAGANYNYVMRNRRFLEERNYIRVDRTNFTRLDLHYHTLDKYKVKFGSDFRLVFVGDDFLDDTYVVPYRLLQDVLVPGNFCTEVGENYSNNRERWKFMIYRHELIFYPNTRQQQVVSNISLTDYHNQYALLGEEAFDIEPFPTKLHPIDRPHSNRLFEEPPLNSYSNNYGYVYFIQGQSTLNIKIGYSNRPYSRLKNLQTACSEGLEILAKIPGTQATEKKLHSRFSKHRLKGEWFFPAPEIMKFIYEIR